MSLQVASSENVQMLSSHPNFTHNHLNLHCCQVTPWTPPWPSPPSSRPWRNLWDMRLGLLAGWRSSSSELDVCLVVARHLRRMFEQHHSFRSALHNSLKIYIWSYFLTWGERLVGDGLRPTSDSWTSSRTWAVCSLSPLPQALEKWQLCPFWFEICQKSVHILPKWCQKLAKMSQYQQLIVSHQQCNYAK